MPSLNRNTILAAAAALGTSSAFGAGSVVFDNTLPGQPHNTTTTVPLLSGRYTIDASNTGVLASKNLFESFTTFNVDTGETALFTNSTNLSINNIIARVTGGGSTTINGTIDTSAFPKTDLWLLNPAGVFLGPGAQLNISGTFHSSDKTAIIFTDGTEFDANSATPVSLSVASPMAFGFIGDTGAQPDVQLDGSLGSSTTIKIVGTSNTCTACSYSSLPAGSTLEVDNGDGVLQSGTHNNLFLSFSRLNVFNGGTLELGTPNTPLDNVIARVTGGTPSMIAGTLTTATSTVTQTVVGQPPTQVTVGPALWLLSPAGFVFGKGFNLNLQQGFAVGATDTLADGSGHNFTTSTTAAQLNGLSFDSASGGWRFEQSSTAPIGDISLQQVGIGPSYGSNVPLGILLYGNHITIADSDIEENSGGSNPLGSVYTAETNGTAISTPAWNRVLSDLGDAPQDARDGIDVVATGPLTITGAGAGTIISTNDSFADGIILTGDSVSSSGAVSLYTSAGVMGVRSAIAIAAAGSIDIDGGAGTFTALTNFDKTTGVTQSAGGTLVVDAGQVTLAHAVLSTAGTAIPDADAPTGDLRIYADGDLNLSNVNWNSAFANLFGAVISSRSGNVDLSGVTLFNSSYNNALLHVSGNDITIDNSSITSEVSGYVDIAAVDTLRVLNNSSIVANNANVLALEGAEIYIDSSQLSLNNAQTYPFVRGGARDPAVLSVGTYAPAPSETTNLFANGCSSCTGNPSTLVSVSNSSISTDTSLKNSVLDTGGSPSPLFQTGRAADVRIEAGTISVSGSKVSTTTSTSNLTYDSSVTPPSSGTGDAGQVFLLASGPLTLSGSLVDSQSTSDTGNAGAITLSGSSVSITGGVRPADFAGVHLPSNTAIFSGTAGPGNAGDISVTATTGSATIDNAAVSAQSVGGGNAGGVQVSGASGVAVSSGSLLQTSVSGSPDSTAGDINLSSPGLVNVDGSTISATSVGSAAAGSISLVGQGVRIGNESEVTAQYTNGGGQPGGAGTILIRATGSADPNDPLQQDFTQPTSGVVRISDSGIIASNDGGNTNPAGRGRIIIGTADASDASSGPDTTAGKTDDVLIAGSVVSTDVLAQGVGEGVNISALKSVWIGASSTPGGGYADPDPDSCAIGANCAAGSFPDLRSSVAQALISSKTQASAASGGTVSISAGQLLTIDGGVIDTRNQISRAQSQQASLTPTDVTIGGNPAAAVQLSGAVVSSETEGDAAAGQVQISGSTVHISSSSISTSTTSAGVAGVISISASGADPQGSDAVAIDRSTIQSSAAGTSGGIAGNAGKITISATSGSVSIGDSAAAAAPTTQIATSANLFAGQAGAIDVRSAGSLTVQNTTIDTSVANSAADVSFAPGTISLGATGMIVLTGSTLSAATSGNVSAGDITVAAGGPLQISSPNTGPRSLVSSSSTSIATGSGQAGEVSLSGATISLDASDVAAVIDGGTASTPPANVTLSSGGAISVADGATIKVDTEGSAPGGAIELLTPGAITVTGAGTTMTSDTSGNGVGGDVELGVPPDAAKGVAAATIASLKVSGGATIAVDASGSGASAGHGGALSVTSSGPVTLSGAGTALSSNSSNNAVGGSVTIASSSLSMDSGASITANTSSNPPVAASADNRRVRAAPTRPPVTGGSVTIGTTGAVSLAGQGTAIAANTSGGGSGGTVTLTASSLALTDGSEISTTATGSGNSGAISINLGSVGSGSSTSLSMANSSITTNAAASTGGNIDINVGGGGLVLAGSEIVTNAGAQGNGGNITINDAGSTTLAGSAILAQADSGNGGAINVFLQPGAVFVKDSGSVVSAQSHTGNDGTITINSPQTDLNSALHVPDVAVERAPELSANVCRRDPSRSTFVREGRGGAPANPDGYLVTLPPASVPGGDKGASSATAANPTDPEPIRWLALATDVPKCR